VSGLTSPGPLVCRAVLFDLDGVLIDSTESFHRHWLSWADRHGLDGEATFEIGHGLRTADHIRLVAPDLDADLEARRFEELEVEDTEGIRAYPGARELLATLPANCWAVVTSSIDLLAKARLRAGGLPVPEVLVSADDVTKGKPHPEGYLLASKLLGVPARDTVVIEDSPAGVGAGLAAGAIVVAVPTTHAPDQLAEAAFVAPLKHIDARQRDATAIELSMRGK